MGSSQQKNFSRPGRLMPEITSTLGPTKRVEMFDGEPPNMSVKMTIFCPWLRAMNFSSWRDHGAAVALPVEGDGLDVELLLEDLLGHLHQLAAQVAVGDNHALDHAISPPGSGAAAAASGAGLALRASR